MQERNFARNANEESTQEQNEKTEGQEKVQKIIKVQAKTEKIEKTKEENYKTMPMQKSSWLARGVFKKRLGRLKEIFHTNQHSRKESIQGLFRYGNGVCEGL